MAVPLADVLHELSPEDRDEVERGARKLIIESRTLRALRKALGVTQGRLADALETTQGNVAQIESKRDVMVSTVTRIVNALGGDLHLIATFPGRARPIRVSLGDGEAVEARSVRVDPSEDAADGEPARARGSRPAGRRTGKSRAATSRKTRSAP